MIRSLDKSGGVFSVCVRWTGRARLKQYLYLLCYKRAKGYLHIWFTALVVTMARLCLYSLYTIIAVGLSLAILLPLAVPLKLMPMPVNQSLSPRPALHTHQQRIETEGTVNWSLDASESLESENRDLIVRFSGNRTQKQDLNADPENLLNGTNLDISDTSAHIGGEALKPTSNPIESEIESKSLDFSEKDFKYKNKLFSVQSMHSMDRMDSMAQNVRQTKVGSFSSSTNIVNKVNSVPTVLTMPTAHSLNFASGPQSISISRESNGHRVREVVSGIGIGATGEASVSVSSGPVVSVKHQIESQSQKRPSLSAGPLNPRLPTKSSRDDTLNIISNGIYWSKQLESLTPHGFGAKDDSRWSQLINSSIVVKMVEGCGRMQNRLLILGDGQMSCARHRLNSDQIQGDIFSFYLARILGISNLPPATVALVKGPTSDRWQRVKNSLQLSRWEQRPIVMTRYVSDLVPAFIPKLLRSDRRRLHPIYEDIGALNVTELVELVQWSDLIIFDYLTANLDRIVNNMINEKWNPEMMRNPAHNLLKVKSSGLLLFIDNESGLLHGYRLLKKYERQHLSMLSALCVFREQTAKLIEQLYKNKNIIYLMKSLFKENVLDSEAYSSLPFLPEHNIKLLYERISRVYHQINYCKSLYQNNNKKF